jgi:hypothetical protein
LVALGADPRHPGEDPGAWLDRVLRPPLFRTARHPGTLTYIFGLTTETRRYANARAIRPYPRGCNNG